MPSQPRNMPEQEHSIKARSHEVFVEPSQGAAPRATKPFPLYLRETPAQPLSPLANTVLWILGIIVVVLFLAALWRITHRRGPASRPRPARPAAEAPVVRTGPCSSPWWTDRPAGVAWQGNPRADLVARGRADRRDHRRWDRAGSVAESPPTAVATATWLRA
jgi:hypothetical protein